MGKATKIGISVALTVLFVWLLLRETDANEYLDCQVSVKSYNSQFLYVYGTVGADSDGPAAVPYRGKAREVLMQLIGGLQSGMSYSGVHTLEEFQQKAVFVRMTGAGLRESGPHDVEVIG